MRLEEVNGNPKNNQNLLAKLAIFCLFKSSFNEFISFFIVHRDFSHYKYNTNLNA